MSDTGLKLIGKYALVLSIAYVLQFAFTEYVESIDVNLEDMPIQVLAPIVFSLLLNIVTAFIVYRDKAKHHINTEYVMIATVLFRPIGVVAFLLYYLYDKRTMAESETNGA